MSEVDTWRLQHCGHRSANKDGHSLLLLRPGFIQAHLYASPETDRESGKLTVKVPWKIGGSQAVKKCSMMDLGQDSPVSCIHGHQSFCSRSIRTFQTSGDLFCLEKLPHPHRGAERFQMSKHLIKDAPGCVFNYHCSDLCCQRPVFMLAFLFSFLSEPLLLYLFHGNNTPTSLVCCVTNVYHCHFVNGLSPLVTRDSL